jgi:predicted permease
MLNDLRYALRMFHRNPGFAAAAVISIGLAIGANAAMFSLADALFLRPLAVPDPSSVVTVGTRPWADDGRLSYADYRDLRDASRSFVNLAAVRWVRAGVARDAASAAELKIGFAVSANFLRTFGVAPVAGRDFAAGDDESRRAVLLLGEDYWTRELGRDPSVIGRPLRLNGRTVDVIGVVPANFAGLFDLARPAFFVPLDMGPVLDDERDDAQLTDRDRRLFTVKGRLAAGVSIAAANEEAGAIFRTLAPSRPSTVRPMEAIVLSELRSRLAGAPGTPRLVALLGALTVVLLCIACGNVANLVLGRASARTREIGVRLAVGAGRWRLVRQLLVESLVLALAGGAAGALIAAGGIAMLRAFAPASGLDVEVPLLIDLDARALLFTFGIAATSALIFGLVPALRAGRSDVLSAIRPGAGDHGRERMMGRTALVVVQVAGSVVLLVAATQLARGFSYVLGQDPGFNTDNRLTMRLDPRLAGYTPERTEQFYGALSARTAALPGVRSAALATALPTTSVFTAVGIAPEGFTFPPGQDRAAIVSASVDPAYFSTLGVRLVQGRGFLASDRADAPWVAIVDETFAARYLKPNPVGQRIRFVELGGRVAEVVGVSVASRHNSVFVPSQPFIYLPLAQHPASTLTLVVHTEGDAAAMANVVRGVAQSIDANVPVFRVETTAELFEQRSKRLARLVGGIAASVGLVGFTMALIGLYAVVAYQVSRRTREIGIRMALGAMQAQVLRMILRRAAAMGLGGVALGTALSAAAGYGLTAGLGVPSFDSALFVAVPVMLVGTTLLAAFVPARRAAAIDPQRALRQD